MTRPKRRATARASLILAPTLLMSAACASGATPALSRSERADAPPMSAELVQSGRRAMQRADLTRAAQYFEAAIALGADVHQVLPVLLRVYVASGRWRLAADRAEAELAHLPRDSRLRWVVAALRSSLGQHDRARHHLEILLRYHPDHASAHYLLAVSLRDQGDDPLTADRHFRRYLELDPGGGHAAEAEASLLGEVP